MSSKFEMKDSKVDDKRKEVILTSPVPLEGQSNVDYKTPNIIRRILSLFGNIRPGADLTHFQLPPMFNIPKSLLQIYGELVYGVKIDLLSKCANGESSIDRMASVVSWSISTARPWMFGVAPYNSILGETHHASRGTLNVLLEQVSHHPGVSALHATDDSNKIEVLWCQHTVPKFLGTLVESVTHGKKIINLLEKGESYAMNYPKLLIRLLPVPGVEWAGNVKIECKQTGLHADLSYKSSSFLGFKGGNRTIKGKIVDSSSLKTLCEIDGQWDGIVKMKNTSDGSSKVIYNAQETIFAVPTPVLRDAEGVWESESTAVWAEVSKGILSKDWAKAREAKTAIEEKQRELVRLRKSKGEIWSPKHFDVSYSPETGWDCLPKQKTVAPAPIILPI